MTRQEVFAAGEVVYNNIIGNGGVHGYEYAIYHDGKFYKVRQWETCMRVVGADKTAVPLDLVAMDFAAHDDGDYDAEYDLRMFREFLDKKKPKKGRRK